MLVLQKRRTLSPAPAPTPPPAQPPPEGNRTFLLLAQATEEMEQYISEITGGGQHSDGFYWSGQCWNSEDGGWDTDVPSQSPALTENWSSSQNRNPITQELQLFELTLTKLQYSASLLINASSEGGTNHDGTVIEIRWFASYHQHTLTSWLNLQKTEKQRLWLLWLFQIKVLSVISQLLSRSQRLCLRASVSSDREGKFPLLPLPPPPQWI